MQKVDAPGRLVRRMKSSPLLTDILVKYGIIRRRSDSGKAANREFLKLCCDDFFIGKFQYLKEFSWDEVLFNSSMQDIYYI
jgi:hypothetical protein